MRRLLAGARGAIKPADYAICHVEQGFNDADGPQTEYPDYYTHPVLAEAIASTGFDACSTASNWTWLKGLDGIARTNGALRRAGVSPAGSRAKPHQEVWTLEDVDGVQVAHLSFTDAADAAVPGADWSVNRGGAREIVAAAREARTAGAEIVVVSLAMGQMGDVSASDEQRRTVRAIARCGQVDLVIGHGSHTIQGAEDVAVCGSCGTATCSRRSSPISGGCMKDW